MTAGNHAARLVAVSVGRPRELTWEGRPLRTSIFKAPVEGRVAVRPHQVEGDEQSDPTVHGGPLKAVYAYPSEHYPYWCGELEQTELPWASFGENLTTEGLLEDTVHIGDRYRIGTLELVVTQPRQPCLKLNARHGRPDMIERFLASGRSGFYMSVADAGELGAGDPIVRVHRDGHGLSVAELALLNTWKDAPAERLERVITHPTLSEGWRERFQRRWEALRT